MTWEGFVVILISTWDFMHGICCLMIARWKAIELLWSLLLESSRGTPKTCFQLQFNIFRWSSDSKYRIMFVVIEEIESEFSELWKIWTFTEFQPGSKNPLIESQDHAALNLCASQLHKTINSLTFCIVFEAKMHKMIYCTSPERCFALSAINQKQTKPKLPF